MNQGIPMVEIKNYCTVDIDRATKDSTTRL